MRHILTIKKDIWIPGRQRDISEKIMKKILVFGMTENPGGIESVIMNYYRNINRDNIQFDFLCNCQSIAYQEEIENLGGHIYSITARKENFWKFRKEMSDFMQLHAKEYEAIWVNVCMLSNIDYLIFAKKYGIPKRIIHCHNSSNDGGEIKLLAHNFNKNRLTKYATHFWTCSADAAEWFFDKNIINGQNYRVITNAIDTSKYVRTDAIRNVYREQLNLTDKIVIGHVGRFHFQKNHEFLIKIFKELSNRNARYQLVLIGQGELEQRIKEIVTKEELEDKVSFLGVRNDVEKLYQCMDAFVMPSQFEGLGLAAIEAQAAGLPCILADTLPVSVKVNDNVCFQSLNQSVKKWADSVENMIKGKRPENKIALSEYNIKNQVKEFEKEL